MKQPTEFRHAAEKSQKGFEMDQFAPFVIWTYTVTLATLAGYIGFLFWRLRKERDE